MITYKKILFGTDFSDDAGMAFLHALDTAKRYGASLTILHVLHSGYRYSRHVVDEMSEEPDGEAFVDEKVLRKARAKLEEVYGSRLGNFTNVTYEILPGIPFVEIVKYARKNDIDLIILGAKGKSELDSVRFGSTVANVAQRAHCHVTAIRNPESQFRLPGALY